jgi:hypothetical protein
MTRTIEQGTSHYKISEQPGRQSGVTPDMCYSALNVVPRGYDVSGGHDASVVMPDGVVVPVFNAATPYVYAWTRNLAGGFTLRSKSLKWNKKTGRWEDDIVEGVLYKFCEPSLNDRFNAGDNKIHFIVLTVVDALTGISQTLVFHITDGQAAILLAGGSVPIEGKPYSYSLIKGFQPCAVHYKNSTKKGVVYVEETHPTLFDFA